MSRIVSRLPAYLFAIANSHLSAVAASAASVTATEESGYANCRASVFGEGYGTLTDRLMHLTDRLLFLMLVHYRPEAEELAMNFLYKPAGVLPTNTNSTTSDALNSASSSNAGADKANNEDLPPLSSTATVSTGLSITSVSAYNQQGDSYGVRMMKERIMRLLLTVRGEFTPVATAVTNSTAVELANASKTTAPSDEKDGEGPDGKASSTNDEGKDSESEKDCNVSIKDDDDSEEFNSDDDDGGVRAKEEREKRRKEGEVRGPPPRGGGNARLTPFHYHALLGSSSFGTPSADCKNRRLSHKEATMTTQRLTRRRKKCGPLKRRKGKKKREKRRMLRIRKSECARKS